MSPAALPELRPDRDGEAELDGLLTAGREFSAEFPLFLANHLPMVIVALHRLGASDARLAQFFASYRDANGLVPMPPAVAPIDRGQWTAALGDRERERDYREFFTAEVQRLGIRAAIATYLPILTPAIAASALHGLMRLAYGVLRNDSAEVGAALGYWSATYLTLGAATGARPVTDDPAEVLLRLQPVASFRHVEIELDLLWNFMAAMAAKDGVPAGCRLAGDRARNAAAGRIGVARPLRRHHGFLRAPCPHGIALAARPLAGSPRSRPRAAPFLAGDRRALSEDRLSRSSCRGSVARMAATRPCPEWPEIKASAARSDDEHDLSLTFSAFEEWSVYGDPLYRYVAARRLRLDCVTDAIACQCSFLPDGNRVDIAIERGRIAAIEPCGAFPAPTIDLAEALVVAGFVDGHIHLDKTLLGLPFVPHRTGSSIAERIARERELRRELAYPVEERARHLIAQVVVHGTTALRTHVDIDTEVGLTGLRALLAVKEETRDLIDIQIVAFPQSGILADPGTADLLDQAIRRRSRSRRRARPRRHRR